MSKSITTNFDFVNTFYIYVTLIQSIGELNVPIKSFMENIIIISLYQLYQSKTI